MVQLWLRSRNTGKALVLVATTISLFVLTAGWQFHLPNQTGQWSQLAVLLPVALGSFLPAMTASTHHDMERLATRPLGGYRLVHIITLLAASAAGIAVVTAQMPVGYFNTASVLRNAALLVGVGLCLAPWIGARRAWIPALVYAVVALAVPTQEFAPSWNLLIQPGHTTSATVAAAGSLMAGLMITAWRAPC